MASNGQEPISAEELKRLGEALKDDKFRQLLLEYAEEIRDPQNRQRYEQEMSILERERGVDLTFIHPEAGYVIKTSTSGAIKTFVNICKNKNVVKPSCSRSKTKAGLDWSVPYFLSPPREDSDKSGRKCTIHDVVFHPDTLYMAQRNARFRKMIEDTALDGIQNKFCIRLDRKNLHYPKLKYKGIPFPTVLRKSTNQTDEENTDKLKGTTLYETSKNELIKEIVKGVSQKEVEPVTITTPKYSLRYRNKIDMESFTVISQQSSNIRPDEIVIDIQLPLLSSAKGVDLDVDKQALTLTCCDIANYKLDLSLPYPVNDKNGSAQFDQATHTLTVTLPVQQIEVSKSSETCQETSNDVQIVNANKESPESVIHRCTMGNLCTSSLAYKMPQFVVNQSSEHVTFVFQVSNVNVNDVLLQVCDCGYGMQVAFPSMEKNLWYSFCVLSQQVIQLEGQCLDSCDANVVLKLSKKDDAEWHCFSYGCYEARGDTYRFINKNNVLENLENMKNETERFLNLGCSLQNEQVNVKAVSESSLQVQVFFGDPSEKETTPERETNGEGACRNSGCIPKSPRKLRTSSESSLDLHSQHAGRRGILKYPRNWRSMSESSDDVTCCYPLDLLPPSPEEDGDEDNMPKKNVRFNDHVAKNIFRANSSIVGQKKKNQKRAQYKKRVAAQRSSSTSSQEETESQESTVTTEEDSEHSSCNESNPELPRKKKTKNGKNAQSHLTQENNAIIDYLVEESNGQLEIDTAEEFTSDIDTNIKETLVEGINRLDVNGDVSTSDSVRMETVNATREDLKPKDVNYYVHDEKIYFAVEMVEDINQQEEALPTDYGMISGNTLCGEANIPEELSDKCETQVKETADENQQVERKVSEMKECPLSEVNFPEMVVSKPLKEIKEPRAKETNSDIEVAANKIRTCESAEEDLDFRTNGYIQEAIELLLSPENTAFQLD